MWMLLRWCAKQTALGRVQRNGYRQNRCKCWHWESLVPHIQIPSCRAERVPSAAAAEGSALHIVAILDIAAIALRASTPVLGL